MKKSLLFASALVAAFSSCSSDSTELSGLTAEQENGLVPIELSLSRFGVTVDETKGAGTVGDVAGTGNVWNNEDIYVLMTTIDSPYGGWGYQDCGGDLGMPFNNVACKPVQNGTAWGLDYSVSSGGAKKYYPIAWSSDFFAYHCDDAATPENDVTLSSETGEAVLPFTLDGSQDLLAGKADDGSNGTSNRRGFSAATARQGVVPVIPMKHLLSRMTFEVISGVNGNAEGLMINAIKVYSKNQGNLLVAYNQAGTKSVSELIRWNEEAEPVAFTLKERKGDIVTNGKKNPWGVMDPIEMGTDGFSKTVNGALFVAPKTGQYDMEISFSYPYVSGEGEISYVTSSLKLPIGSADTKFEIGKSYHVKVTVYGYSEIQVEATLEPWVEGEDFDIDCAEPLN